MEALRCGATDYVIKDRPARLISAIQGALEQRHEFQLWQRAEQRLREQAELLDKARDAICVTNLEHRITYWNASAERLYGWTAAEVIDRPLAELALGYDAARFAAAHAQLLASGEWRGTFRLRNKNGDLLQVESTWSLVLTDKGERRSILLIDTDVTEKMRLETQLLRAGRLDSIGMLAGGVAHDLNNVLAPILMGSELLRLSIEDQKIRARLHSLDLARRPFLRQDGVDQLGVDDAVFQMQQMPQTGGSEGVSHGRSGLGFGPDRTGRRFIMDCPESAQLPDDIEEGLEIDGFHDVGINTQAVAFHHVRFFARRGEHHDGNVF